MPREAVQRRVARRSRREPGPRHGRGRRGV